MTASALWRDDLDCLVFTPAGHGGECVVHRRAFRVLVGREAEAESCRRYFAEHRSAFERAAAAKIAKKSLGTAERLHLTSRDIRRA